ncbi:MAG: hypothetical protein ACYCTL_13535 [Acidimicrobiales bacterium]
MSSFGISGGGRKAENLFREITGANRTRKAAEGDALLEGHPIEVKRATSVTLNQVRAVKYLPIVVYFEPRDEWYVIPAHVVVVAVSQKRRGQHTENPFESATLNLNNLSRYKIEDAQHLKSATLQAIKDSKQFPQLREAMKDLLCESRKLADESLRRIRELLDTLGLGT